MDIHTHMTLRLGVMFADLFEKNCLWLSALNQPEDKKAELERDAEAHARMGKFYQAILDANDNPKEEA